MLQQLLPAQPAATIRVIPAAILAVIQVATQVVTRAAIFPILCAEHHAMLQHAAY